MAITGEWHGCHSKNNVSFQVMQLSDKSCELAEENDRLFDKNREQMRRIELLETEQSELVNKLCCVF